jgi:hypothetical protein
MSNTADDDDSEDERVACGDERRAIGQRSVITVGLSEHQAVRGPQ